MKNLITTLMLISSFVFAQIPQTVSFQGYLSDSNGEPISDGNYEVTFRLFDSLTEGNNVWEETHSMVITGSLISVRLGSFTSIVLPETGIPYLEIQIEDEILTPRQELTSVIYALEAKHTAIADTASFATKSDTANYANYAASSQNSLHSDLADNATMLGGNTADYYMPITVYGYVDAVTCQTSTWTTLLEVNITIPDSMYIYSFGTVSGAGWYDSKKMLQISIYDESYSNFYGYANPWGDVANAVHYLPAGTYHIHLYGLNIEGSSQDMSNITLYAIALNPSQNNTVRTGPFPPPENAELPNPSEILNH